MATLTRLSLGIAVTVLAIAGSEAAPEMRLLQSRHGSSTSGESVFVTDVIENSLALLHSRQCIPADFDWTSEEHAALGAQLANCQAKANGGDLDGACDGASVASIYFSCLASSAKELDAAGTSFDVSAFENNVVGYSGDAGWSHSEEDMFAACKRDADADLTPRQQAVFAYACMRWSTNAACSQKQEQEQRLDADGKLRLARFLSGDCPMSPSQLLDAFGLVTGRTWAECSQGVYTGDDYDAEVSRVACLLQDFKTAAGNVDFPSLEGAIATAEGGGRSASTYVLQTVVDICGTDSPVTATAGSMRAFNEMSAEELVRCWAGWGLFSCAYKEANELAHQFPQTCTVSV